MEIVIQAANRNPKSRAPLADDIALTYWDTVGSLKFEVVKAFLYILG